MLVWAKHNRYRTQNRRAEGWGCDYIHIFDDIDNMYRGRTVTLKISAFYHHIKHIVFTVVSFANVAWSSAAISAALSVQLNMFKSSFI